MISKNAAGLIILALSLAGIEITEEMALQVISAVGTLVSFGLLIWNQLGREDVKNFFFKKD